jgi:hypothetical protein
MRINQYQEDQNIPWLHECTGIKPNGKRVGMATFHKDSPDIAWINTKGDSMTCIGAKSIPDGARILIKKIPKDPFSIPIGKPAVIMGETNGKLFLVCKLITFVDLVYNRVKCESLNKKYDPFWIPLHCILDIYEVEEVSID